MVRNVDTDVVMLALANFDNLSLRYLSVHCIFLLLGNQGSDTLLAFYALTGCHHTSALAHKSRKTLWDTWNVYDNITLVLHQQSISSNLTICHPDV